MTYIRDSSPRIRDSQDSRFSPLTGRRVSGPAPSSGGSVTSTIAIEASSVGLVIGRQGENMRRLESTTRTRIQFAPASETEDGMRKCTITGTREAIEDAISEIQRIMDDHDKGPRGSERRAPPPAGRNLAPETPSNGRRDPQPSKDGESRTIMVPSKTVGLIIGKRGESIKDIQDRSHCHVNIMTEDHNINGLRPVHLIGTTQQAAMAEQIIMDIVHTDAKALPHETAAIRDVSKPIQNNARTSNEKLTINIKVPSEAVGMIIGKRGEAVRDMQDTTNCKINVSQPTGSDIEREIELIGSPYSIQQAEAAIQEKVRAVVRSIFDSPRQLLTLNSRRRTPVSAPSHGLIPRICSLVLEILHPSRFRLCPRKAASHLVVTKRMPPTVVIRTTSPFGTPHKDNRPYRISLLHPDTTQEYIVRAACHIVQLGYREKHLARARLPLVLSQLWYDPP